MDFLFRDYNWVNTMHILVGPILALIAYMSHEYCFNDTFDEYKRLIKGLLIGQICVGIGVALYHGYLLFQKNSHGEHGH